MSTTGGKGTTGIRALAAAVRGSPLIIKGGTYVTASALAQGIMMVSWISLTWALSPAEIGQFALVSFGIELSTRVTMLGMDSAVVRFMVEDDHREEVLRAIHVWLLVGAGTAVLGVWATEDLVTGQVASLAGLYPRVTGIMLAAGIATAFANVVFGYHVARGEATAYARLTLLRSILLGTGYAGAAFGGLGVPGLVLAHVLAGSVVSAVFYANPEARRGWGPVSFRRMREVAAYGLPMAAYSAVSLFSDYLGRLLIGLKVSVEALGVFQFFYQIVIQLNGVWASLNRAWTPHVFKLMSRSRAEAFGSVHAGTGIAAIIAASGLVLLLTLGGVGALSLVLPQGMEEGLSLFYVLASGTLFTALYTAVYPVFYFDKNTVRVSSIQSAVSVTTVLATVYLTVQAGATGASLAWVFGTILAPWAYYAGFPGLHGELRPVLVTLLVWTLAVGTSAFSVLWLDTVSLSLLALGTAIAWQLHQIRRRWHRNAAPAGGAAW